MNIITNKTLVAIFSASIAVISLVGQAQSMNPSLTASEYVDLIEGYSHKNIIQPITFDSGKAVIRDDEFEKLEQLINLYTGKDSISVVFVGHTDNQQLSKKTQSEHKDNFELSQSRAKRVMSEFNNYLGKHTNVILSYAGMGPKQPVASNESQQGMSLNRRVEVHFIYSTEVDLRNSLATMNSYSAKRSYDGHYKNASATYALDADADTHYVKAGEMAKLESIALNNCAENCDNLEAIDGPVVIENKAAVNTIDQVISLPAKSSSSKKAEWKQAVKSEKPIAVKTETQPAELNEIKTASAVKADESVLVKPEAPKEVAELTKPAVKQVAELNETKDAPGVKQIAVKSESTKEVATLTKPAAKPIVRELATTSAVKQVAVTSEVQKEIATLTQSEAKPIIRELATTSAVKQAAVTSEAQQEVAALTKPAAKPIVRAQAAKSAVKQAAAKSQISSKSACGGYAYGGCYDLALKSDFKFRETLAIEAAPASKVASLSKPVANKNAAIKQAKTRFVQKVVTRVAKKSLAASKLETTASSKESSSTKASKEVSEKYAVLALSSFRSLRKVEAKKEVKKEAPVVEREILVLEKKAPVVEREILVLEKKAPVVEREILVLEKKAPVVEREILVLEKKAPVVEREILVKK